MKYTNARFSLHDKVLSVLYVSTLHEVLKAEGYSLQGFSGSLNALNNHRKRITPQQYMSILEQSLKSTAPTGLGFKYGALLDIAGAGTLGQLMLTCNNLEQGFEKFLTYYPLLSLSLEFNNNWNANLYTVEVERICNKEMRPQVQWLLTESLFYCWLQQARFLTAQPIQFSHVSFKYAPPPHWRKYEKVFGCTVEFNSPVNSVSLNRENLATKIPTANESVRMIKENHCREVLLRWKSRFSISEQISDILNQSLPDIPSLEIMAEQLSLSRSSLYRRLRDDGSNYQTIVDKLRRDKAIQQLKSDKNTICEIAERLGFSDVSNFRRAFKKWTGYKPSDLRDGLIPAVTASAGISGQIKD
jgi:AraC-like DNA-binding protein